jgi:hypothetical protein
MSLLKEGIMTDDWDENEIRALVEKIGRIVRPQYDLGDDEEYLPEVLSNCLKKLEEYKEHPPPASMSKWRFVEWMARRTAVKRLRER